MHRPAPAQAGAGHLQRAQRQSHQKYQAWLGALALAGCGGSGNDREAARSTATPRPVATNEPRTQAIREVANRYLAEFAAKDWTGVCATLVPSERRYFDRLAGSCEKVFRNNDAGSLRVLRDSRAGEIRIGPHQAVIEVNELGWREPLLYLYAIQEQGRWGIARSKKLRES